MKRLSIITIILCTVLTAGVMLMRMKYAVKAPISGYGIVIHGLTDGIEVKSGDILDGISVSIPAGYTSDEIISISSDTNIVYLELDRGNADDRIITGKLVALSEGIGEVSIRTADDEFESVKYTVTVYSEAENTQKIRMIR